MQTKIKESPILATVVQSSLYMVKLLAIWIFLRGHQEPGGGFVAGLLVAAAIALQGLAFGYKAADSIFPVPFHLLLGSGLVLAFATVLAPVFLGYPFMKQFFDHWSFPGFLGDVEVATAAIFDLGVFLVVVATMKVTLLQIAGEKGSGRERPGESEPSRRRRQEV